MSLGSRAVLFVRREALLSVAVLLQAADLLTFAAMIVVWGFSVEGNPLIQLALSVAPEAIVALVFIGLKVALVALIVKVARIAQPPLRAAVLLVAIAAGLYGAFFNFANVWVGLTDSGYPQPPAAVSPNAR